MNHRNHFLKFWFIVFECLLLWTRPLLIIAVATVVCSYIQSVSRRGRWGISQKNCRCNVYIPLDSEKFTFSPPERIVRSIFRKESRRCQLWYPHRWYDFHIYVLVHFSIPYLGFWLNFLLGGTKRVCF